METAGSSKQYLSDLREIADSLQELAPQIESKNFFVSGGTGFLGHWLVDSLLAMDAKVTVMTRNATAALEKTPYWNNCSSLSFGSEGQFDYAIHAGVDLQHSAQETLQFAQQFFETCKKSGVKKILFLSSGAIYHFSKTKPTQFLETEELSAPPPGSPAYAEGKWLVEQKGIKRAAVGDFEFKIARCFSFIGPHQDLRSHHAVSDFLTCAIEGRPIVIQGTGKTERSFLYASEFAVGALNILFHGKSARPYNLGAKKATTVLDLAKEIDRCRKIPLAPIQVLGKATSNMSQSDAYIPNVERMEQELQFTQKIQLSEAVQRTARHFSETLPLSQIKPF